MSISRRDFIAVSISSMLLFNDSINEDLPSIESVIDSVLDKYQFNKIIISNEEILEIKKSRVYRTLYKGS